LAADSGGTIFPGYLIAAEKGLTWAAEMTGVWPGGHAARKMVQLLIENAVVLELAERVPVWVAPSR
jgi:hypothetical protein